MSAATDIAAAIVSLCQDTGTRQVLQIRVMADETLDDVEHVQPYGFASVPQLPGATGAPEAIVVFLGDRSKGVVIAVDDRRYRIAAGLPGEVAIYDDLGQKVHLTRTKIVIDPAVGNTIEIVAGATKGAARADDATVHTAALDAAWYAWLAAVGAATGAGAPPATITGKISAGSAIVKVG